MPAGTDGALPECLERLVESAVQKQLLPGNLGAEFAARFLSWFDG